MGKKIICEVCKKPMENIGNVDNKVYTSNPPQWNEVYICVKDKRRKTVRVDADIPTHYSLEGFKEQL